MDLVERAESLMSTGRRAFLGITGPPGAGKSTLAERIVAEINARHPRETPVCVSVPMDGFHLSDAALAQLGRLDRKGAIDTFDGSGYLSMLRRLAVETDRRVFAPSFERRLEQPIAAGIIVEPSVGLVVTEGNYLLVASDPWPTIRQALDEVWFCRLDREVRMRRLIARHVEFGKRPDEARAWVERVDEPNARQVEAEAGHADLVVDMPGDSP